MENKSIATSYCINIPEGATNGDVIKAMFPKAEIRNRTLGGGHISLGKEVLLREDFKVYIPDSFWNAPYKADKENEND